MSEGHLNQTVVQARRVLGDNAQAQQLIRTVPGFGYRWVDTVEETLADTSAGEAVQPPVLPPQNDAPMALASDEITVDIAAGPPTRRRAWMAAAALLLLAIAVALVVMAYRSSSAPAVSIRAGDGHSVAVLPVSVEASAGSAWVRLGLMDLVAGRLRGTGLPVPPSEAVLLAVQDVVARTRQPRGQGASYVPAWAIHPLNVRAA